MKAKSISQKPKLTVEEKGIAKWINESATSLKYRELELMNGLGAEVQIWRGLLAGLAL